MTEPSLQTAGASSVADLTSTTAIPLYEQVKRQISELILVGAWAPGTVLPGEVQMAAQFGVAVGTVRRALQDLVAEGLVMRRRKTGTVVTGRTPHHSLRLFFQYFRLHGLDGSLLRSDTVTLYRVDRLANETDRQQLDLGPQDTVIELTRVRKIDGRRIMHETMAIPASRVPDLPSVADLPPLLYLYLLEQHGIRIAAVRESIWADTATLNDARLLDLDGAQAVLVIDEVAYDQAGAPTIHAIHRAATNQHRYINEVR
ncbi:MAG: GntR family transcriptional regulator [Pseudomonadota bacterium]